MWGSLVVIEIFKHELKDILLTISYESYGTTNILNLSSGVNNVFGCHLGLMVTLVKYNTHCKTLISNGIHENKFI